MVFRPNEYHNKDGIGMPADDMALNTTDPNAAVALLKGIFGKLGGGTTAALITEKTQGSTTAGQGGVLTQGAATTAAPTYGTGTTNPLSLKTNGDLRVSDADATALLTTAVATLSTLNFNTDTLETALGITAETAPATDTATSGLNGRLQRIAKLLSAQISSARIDDLYDLICNNATADAIAFDQLHLDLVAARRTPNAAIRLPSAAGTTNATSGVVGPCLMFNIQGLNAAASTRYLKLYDLARAPTVGTDMPAKTLALPTSAGFAFDWATPFQFMRGLAYALTTGAADSDSNAVTAADIVGLNIDYA